jgi:hypothetical protein
MSRCCSTDAAVERLMYLNAADMLTFKSHSKCR